MTDSALGEKGLIHQDDRPLIVFKEGRRVYRCDNPARREVCQYRIDGGVICDPAVQRCDYALDVVELGKRYFIELKGHDLARAYDQIMSTITVLGLRGSARTLYARIVASNNRRPDLQNARHRALARLIGRHRDAIVVRSGEFRETLEP